MATLKETAEFALLGASGGYFPLDSSLADLSGNARDLTAIGTATYEAGKYGNALLCSSGNAAQRVSATDFDVTTGALSLGALFKTTSVTAYLPLVGKEVGSGQYTGYMIFVNRGSANVLGVDFVQSLAAQDNIQATTTIDDGLWHLAIATRPATNGTIYLYLDGVQVGSGVNNNRNVSSTANFAVGQRGDPLYFVGDIDDAFVMPGVELTATQAFDIWVEKLRKITQLNQAIKRASFW